MGFKDHVARDIRAIYSNTDEHADLTRVRYNSKRARRIPVTFDHDGHGQERKKPAAPFSDNVNDVFVSDLVVYIAVEDLNTIPRRETPIEIGDEVYNIIRADNESGIMKLWLSMYDE